MIEKLQEIIDSSNSIVFFGGAGVSTESGIPDFRSTSGLYHQEWNYPPETILSKTFFNQHTAEFYRFYNAKMLTEKVEPNPAHLKLAEMEAHGKLSCVITQNIDGLHQKAGSKTVYELHGSTLRNYCTECKAFYDVSYMTNKEHWDVKGIPRCTKCNGIIKPDVVLYEENLDTTTLNNAKKAIAEAEVLIIGGTSLVVYPAASLIHYFKGKKLVLINKSETQADHTADLVIHDSIGKVFSQIQI